MQLFLDSAAEELITYWLAQGIVDGITTNPSVMRRDGITDLVGPRQSSPHLWHRGPCASRRPA